MQNTAWQKSTWSNRRMTYVAMKVNINIINDWAANDTDAVMYQLIGSSINKAVQTVKIGVPWPRIVEAACAFYIIFSQRWSVLYSMHDLFPCTAFTLYMLVYVDIFCHITTFCVKYFIGSVLSLVGHELSSLSQRDHTPVEGWSIIHSPILAITEHEMLCLWFYPFQKYRDVPKL